MSGYVRTWGEKAFTQKECISEGLQLCLELHLADPWTTRY